MCVICVYMNTLMSWSSLFGSNIVLLDLTHLSQVTLIIVLLIRPNKKISLSQLPQAQNPKSYAI